MLNMLSLCSGIGGIDLAAGWAGIKTVAFCEKDLYCQRVLKKHWPDTPIFDDIKTLNKGGLERAGISRIDIVATGYPCQPYSLIGERRGEEDDRALWPYVFDRISEIRPRWFIGENVAGHVSMGLDDVLSDLESVNYTTQPIVIPAASVGANDERYRLFVVANLDCAGLESGSKTITHTKNAGKFIPGSGFTVIPPAITPRNEWKHKPLLGRGIHGIPNRMDRIRTLGNAVKPQQIYPILAAIAEIERKELLNND
ncbi:DNA cytosine methyltransferase [Sporomusa sp. KB1]|jgi:DNA (cytosine-5)-methyltransferase 1|uniref:DNA cytosine methyltransferase n=1 Tax=Sporomusa sp. KB1 TaxID=943346 RepID=UPI0011A984C6|nr:DNA cytosine methyltransferase [Sporomusa sp. KB1]TWH49615.1 DNA (cytosine-5)-methyltransferase 1 [Sporomusa sp. KB1]